MCHIADIMTVYSKSANITTWFMSANGKAACVPILACRDVVYVLTTLFRYYPQNIYLIVEMLNTAVALKSAKQFLVEGT